MNNSLIWFDGALVAWQDATTHVMSHTLHYGSGVFEGIRCYATARGPAIFRLSDHIDRLIKSFAHFGTALPWSKETLENAVIEVVKANGFKECYIRPLIFFGSESLALSPKNLSIHCAISAFPVATLGDAQAYTVGISSFKRLHPDCVPIASKVNGFYVNSIFASHEVHKRGFDEALLLDNQGNVSEGAVANFFIVQNGVLQTPPLGTILPGITRDTVFAIAKYLNLPIEEKSISTKDLEKAQEVFFTGTAREIAPIKKIEQQDFVAPGSITKQIQKEFEAIVHGNHDRFKSWLTFLP
jgi:branched-chain amino acid aminotransferase